MPATPIVTVATLPTSSAMNTSLIRRTKTTARANRPPPRRRLRHGKLMAHTHLKLVLGSVNGGHPGMKVGAMTLLNLQYKINPGMDHFVAKSAFSSGLRQKLQQRTRKNNLAAVAAVNP
tara:strand:- start:1609 stop:1965 length:357 start_codon:yes stop_codon:yes gene_type:complete